MLTNLAAFLEIGGKFFNIKRNVTLLSAPNVRKLVSVTPIGA